MAFLQTKSQAAHFRPTLCTGLFLGITFREKEIVIATKIGWRKTVLLACSKACMELAGYNSRGTRETQSRVAACRAVLRESAGPCRTSIRWT